MGPVQVLVVGFDRPAFSGELLAEFARLRDAGIVRLVDLLLVSRDPDGTLETLTPPAELGSELGGLAAALLGRPADGSGDPEATGDQPDDGAWSLADSVPAGSGRGGRAHRAHVGGPADRGAAAGGGSAGAPGDLAGPRRRRRAGEPDRPPGRLTRTGPTGPG